MVVEVSRVQRPRPEDLGMVEWLLICRGFTRFVCMQATRLSSGFAKNNAVYRN